MRALTRLLVPVLALSAAALAQPAGAAVYCAGEASTFVACAETPDPTLGSRDLCVFLGPPPCTPMTVPTVGLVGSPDVNCGGSTTWDIFCARVVNPIL